MTQQEIDYRIYIADLINSATDYFLTHEETTKEQYIEMKEYKQYLRDIDIYNYELKPIPSFFKLSSYYKEQIKRYETDYNISIDLNII